jgi:hypothetical protein
MLALVTGVSSVDNASFGNTMSVTMRVLLPPDICSRCRSSGSEVGTAMGGQGLEAGYSRPPYQHPPPSMILVKLIDPNKDQGPRIYYEFNSQK